MYRRRPALAGLALAAAAVAVAVAPASANTTERFNFADTIVDRYSCSVTLTTNVQGDGTAHFASDGTWLSALIRVQYQGVVANPATGETIELTGRQIVTDAPGSVTSRGQGMFIRVPGKGVVLQDVGRLVFDPADGSTLAASAHVIRFDDPTAAARIDAAVCSLFS